MDPILSTPSPPVAPEPQPGRPAPPTASPSLNSGAPNALHPHHHYGFVHASQSLLYIIVTAIFIVTFVVQPFRIPSSSMEPTLLVGDFLLVDKQNAAPGPALHILPSSTVHRGDIVIFYYPVNPAMHLIKRVVGLPGDHLRLHDQHVYINGQPLTESYAVYRPGNPDNFRDNFPRLQSANPDIAPVWWIKMHSLIDHGELVIPPGNYFVLGDNRNDSEDSRYWGFVPRAAIVGEPVFIYFSLRHAEDEDISADPFAVSKPLQPHQTSHGSTWIDAVLNFARWNRIFHTVR